MWKHLVLLVFFACSSLFVAGQQGSKTSSKSTQNKQATTQQQLDFTSEKTPPQYNGGKQAMYKFIQQNMKYPADAKEKGIQGDVLLKFFVSVDGTITKVEVVQGLFPSLDAEAIRVVKMMPKWIPGKYGTQNAGMNTSLIIGFHLTE
jgi:TonB family protein